MRFSKLLLLLTTCLPFSLVAAQTLTIISGKTELRADPALLNSLGIDTVSMDYSRAYPKRMMHYRAVNLCKLLSKVPMRKTEVIEWVAEDNFSVFIPTELFMDCEKQQSIPYLAIEGKEKWPQLSNGTNSTAGPYAIIWTNPAAAHISNEYWAWSVTKAIVHPAIPKGKIYPPPKTANTSIANGYQMYVSRCASCHTIDGKGVGKIGPDLGGPFNPVQLYPKRNTLRRFIRNPAAVKYPVKVRLSGTGKDSLSDGELTDLLNYFDYLNKQVKPQP